MSDLIVDFPNRNSLPAKAEVHFAPMTQITFIEQINDKYADSLWYSQQDYKAMRVANKQAVLHAHRRLGDAMSLSSSSSIDDQEDGCLTGIENILTPSAIRKTKARRMQCTRAILLEQDRQYEAGVDDPEKLARISRHYSTPASRKAQKVGYIQSI